MRLAATLCLAQLICVLATPARSAVLFDFEAFADATILTTQLQGQGIVPNACHDLSDPRAMRSKGSAWIGWSRHDPQTGSTGQERNRSHEWR